MTLTEQLLVRRGVNIDEGLGQWWGGLATWKKVLLALGVIAAAGGGIYLILKRLRAAAEKGEQQLDAEVNKHIDELKSLKSKIDEAVSRLSEAENQVKATDLDLAARAVNIDPDISREVATSSRFTRTSEKLASVLADIGNIRSQVEHWGRSFDSTIRKIESSRGGAGGRGDALSYGAGMIPGHRGTAADLIKTIDSTIKYTGEQVAAAKESIKSLDHAISVLKQAKVTPTVDTPSAPTVKPSSKKPGIDLSKMGSYVITAQMDDKVERLLNAASKLPWESPERQALQRMAAAHQGLRSADAAIERTEQLLKTAQLQAGYKPGDEKKLQDYLEKAKQQRSKNLGIIKELEAFVGDQAKAAPGPTPTTTIAGMDPHDPAGAKYFSDVMSRAEQLKRHWHPSRHADIDRVIEIMTKKGKLSGEYEKEIFRQLSGKSPLRLESVNDMIDFVLEGYDPGDVWDAVEQDHAKGFLQDVIPPEAQDVAGKVDIKLSKKNPRFHRKEAELEYKVGGVKHRKRVRSAQNYKEKEIDRPGVKGFSRMAVKSYSSELARGTPPWF